MESERENAARWRSRDRRDGEDSSGTPRAVTEAEHHHHVATPPRPAPVADDRIYTCPMHPEVRQKGPGTCPKCGMALEPEAPSADEGPSHELIDMTRRFWVSLALTVPVVTLAMGEMLTPALVAALGVR